MKITSKLFSLLCQEDFVVRGYEVIGRLSLQITYNLATDWYGLKSSPVNRALVQASPHISVISSTVGTHLTTLSVRYRPPVIMIPYKYSYSWSIVFHSRSPLRMSKTSSSESLVSEGMSSASQYGFRTISVNKPTPTQLNIYYFLGT